MAKKDPKYKKLSPEQREKLEKAGIEESGNLGVNTSGSDINISAVDAGKKKYESLKAAGKLNEFLQPKKPSQPKTQSPQEPVVEKLTPEYSTPDEMKGSGYFPPSENKFVSIDPGVIQENVINDGLSKIVSGDKFKQQREDQGFTAEDQALESAAQYGDEVVKNAAKVESNMRLVESLNSNIEDADDPYVQANQSLTVDQVENMTDDEINSAIFGSEGFDKRGKMYRDWLQSQKVNVGEPAIEKLGLQQYYPDINKPLQVGTYSGSIVGSNPIFVASGGTMPVGIIDARKRSLENAAKKRAKNKQKIVEMAFAKGAIPYQDQIDDLSMSGLEKFGEATGWDFSGLMDPSNPLAKDWWKWTAKMKSFANRTKMTEELVNKMDEEELKENTYFPPHARQARSVWNSGRLNMNDYFDNWEKFDKVEQMLQDYGNASHYLKKQSTGLKLDAAPIRADIDFSNPQVAKNVNEAIGKIRGGDYDNIYTVMSKFMDMSRVKGIVDQTIMDRNLYMGKSKKEAEKIRSGYYDLFASYFAKQVGVDKLMTAMHKRSQFNKRMDYQKKKDMTFYTNVVNNDVENPQGRENIGRMSHMYKQGAATPSDVRQVYNQHTGFKPVVDPNDPNKLQGELPPSKDQLSKRYFVNPESSTIVLSDGREMKYSDAVNLGKQEFENLSKPQGQKLATGKPSVKNELIGLYQYNENMKGGSVPVNMVNRTHNYALETPEGPQVLDMTNYSENSDNAVNYVSHVFSGNVEIETNKKDAYGNDVQGYMVMDDEGEVEYFDSLESAETFAKNNNVKSKPVPSVVKTKDNFQLPKMKFGANIDDEQNRSIMDSYLTTEGAQLKKSQSGTIDQQIPIESGGDSSASSGGLFDLMNEVETGNTD